MIGSFYFLTTRSDWDYTVGYNALYKRHLDKLAKKEGICLDKAEALRDYLV